MARRQRPNRAWQQRPSNKSWDRHEDDELITAMQVGAMIECLPAVLPGHSFGDILQRRLDLKRQGLLTQADPL